MARQITTKQMREYVIEDLRLESGLKQIDERTVWNWLMSTRIRTAFLNAATKEI